MCAYQFRFATEYVPYVTEDVHFSTSRVVLGKLKQTLELVSVVCVRVCVCICVCVCYLSGSKSAYRG